MNAALLIGSIVVLLLRQSTGKDHYCDFIEALFKPDRFRRHPKWRSSDCFSGSVRLCVQLGQNKV